MIATMNIESRFTSHVLRFCERYNMSKTAFGQRAVGDGGFVPDLSAGRRSPTLSTVGRVLAFMAEHRRTVSVNEISEGHDD